MRYAWASPTTAVGMVFVLLALASGGRARAAAGVIEAHGGAVTRGLRWLGVRAMTLGHVVLGLDPLALRLTRAHERIHVRQCERWGPLFLPAYLLASLVAAARGRHYYRDNAFERQAFAEAPPLHLARRGARRHREPIEAHQP